ncbi:MAG: adenylate/guanylate cyclase domain-containing protein [Actinomycetota bacterium]
MTDVPETRYAKTADGVHIAYQVLGSGPVDMVFVMGWVTNVEAMWEDPDFARFLRRLATFSRLILFDKRGVGLSDRVHDDRLPDLETRMDDVRAVMDAVGSDRAVVFGVSEGGPMSMVFAATYPERTIALALYGTAADFTTREPAYKENAAAYLARMEEDWGTEAFARHEIEAWAAPGHEDDERLLTWLASYMRRSASPGAAVALERMNREINAAHALASIHVPTIAIARTDDRDFPVEESRATADRIVGATFVEIPGDVHFPWVGAQEAILDEVERFVVGLGEIEAELDRALATVLFTDIVASTERAAQLGDRRWKTLLEEHHRRVRGQLARFRGVEVDTAGDGFFATFDGPARAVRCARSIVDAVAPLDVEVRAGVHTGEVETIDGKVGGMGVVIGARVGALAGTSDVLVSQTVKDLVAGSGLAFEDAGEHELKGVPDRWRLYRVVSGLEIPPSISRSADAPDGLDPVKKVDTTVEQLLDTMPDDVRRTMVELDEIVTSCLPGRTRSIWEGTFWGGTQQRIIGYGDIVQQRPRGADVEWFLVGLARQARHYSLYVNAVEDGRYLVASYADRIGKVKVGSASIRFARLDDVDLDELRALLTKAHELTRAESAGGGSTARP